MRGNKILRKSLIVLKKKKSFFLFHTSSFLQIKRPGNTKNQFGKTGTGKERERERERERENELINVKKCFYPLVGGGGGGVEVLYTQLVFLVQLILCQSIYSSQIFETSIIRKPNQRRKLSYFLFSFLQKVIEINFFVNRRQKSVVFISHIRRIS